MSTWIKTDCAIIKIPKISAFTFIPERGIFAFFSGEEEDCFMLVDKPTMEINGNALRAGIEALMEWETEGWFPAGVEVSGNHPFRAPIITVAQLIEIGRATLAPVE